MQEITKFDPKSLKHGKGRHNAKNTKFAKLSTSKLRNPLGMIPEKERLMSVGEGAFLNKSLLTAQNMIWSIVMKMSISCVPQKMCNEKLCYTPPPPRYKRTDARIKQKNTSTLQLHRSGNKTNPDWSVGNALQLWNYLSALRQQKITNILTNIIIPSSSLAQALRIIYVITPCGKNIVVAYMTIRELF